MPIKKAVKQAAAPTRRVAGGDEGEAGNGNQAPRSKADAFDNVKATGAITPGKYEAVIVEFVLQAPDEKGQSARVKLEIASEGEMQGTEAVQFYKLFEADETPAKGASFFKRDLALLGHSDVQFGDVEEVLEEITDEHLGVVVTVKQNGQYTNVYLNGLCEDSDIIASYLAQRGEFPERD